MAMPAKKEMKKGYRLALLMPKLLWVLAGNYDQVED